MLKKQFMVSNYFGLIMYNNMRVSLRRVNVALEDLM